VLSINLTQTAHWIEAFKLRMERRKLLDCIHTMEDASATSFVDKQTRARIDTDLARNRCYGTWTDGRQR
jgi:hypothetical protein